MPDSHVFNNVITHTHTHTEVLSVVYEPLHGRCLMLESLLCAAAHLVPAVSTVKEIRSEDDRQITAVHLILSTSETTERYTHTLHVFGHRKSLGAADNDHN